MGCIRLGIDIILNTHALQETVCGVGNMKMDGNRKNIPLLVSLQNRPGTRYIAIDLESTCWAKNPPYPNEIIEIGAVAYEIGTGVLAEFEAFIRPCIAPVLSDFCRALTTIKQEEIDAAPQFPEVYGEFCRWAEAYRPFILTSWGHYDRKQILRECARHHIPCNIENHLCLKTLFAEVMNRRKCGMRRALQNIGVPFLGTHHRGLDDARNITEILEYLVSVNLPAGNECAETHRRLIWRRGRANTTDIAGPVAGDRDIDLDYEYPRRTEETRTYAAAPHRGERGRQDRPGRRPRK